MKVLSFRIIIRRLSDTMEKRTLVKYADGIYISLTLYDDLVIAAIETSRQRFISEQRIPARSNRGHITTRFC